MKTVLAITVIAVGMVLAGSARADRYPMVTPQGKEVVAHTRAAPVIVHRVLPPYGIGKHVYVRGR